MGNNNIIIEASLQTVGPLSIAMPVAQGSKANEYGNFPIMGRGIDDDGRARLTGYLPASTVRGFLRRSAGLAAMRQRGVGSTTLHQAYSDILGQGSDTKDDVDLLKLQALREADPILDLLGSWSVRSRLLVSNFLPEVNLLPSAITVVRKDLEDTDGVLEMLNEQDRQAYFERSDKNADRAAKDGKLKVTISARRKAEKTGNAKEVERLDEMIRNLKVEVEALKESLGDMANSSRTIAEYHALPAGVGLAGRIVIQNPKERDVAMLTQALNALSLRPILGAQSARGCGEVSGRFDFLRQGVLFRTVSVGAWKPAHVVDFDASPALV